MSGLDPHRTKPDRKAAKKYARSQRPPHHATGFDPNAPFLAEQWMAGGGGWASSIYRLMRRLIVRPRD